MDKIDILGIKVDKIDRTAALEKVRDFLSLEKQRLVFTPNPEIILAAGRDEELYYILNSADLLLPDGIGLKLAAWSSGQNLKRVTGADLAQDVLGLAEEKGKKVGVLLWKKGLSGKKMVETALKRRYPKLLFAVEAVERDRDAELPKEFLAFKSEIVFVCFGAPWQEKFIFHNIKRIPSAKIAFGVGGAFDFISGAALRAPKFLRQLGLEWLWRLIRQPRRFRRIIDAVVVFPYRFLRRRLIHPLFYRPNVSCLLYKKDGGRYKILLVERRDEPGHWQLPQGGTDGESLLAAGARELEEEINCSQFIPKRVFKDLYRYKFGDRPGEKGDRVERCRKSTGYKGQKQGLFIAEFTGRDENIKVNFWDHSTWKWADSERLVDEVHLIRKRAAQRFLKKFKEFVKQK